MNYESAGAGFSSDGVYRWRLWRHWDLRKGTVCWVLLNPSTADAERLDPTCRRCEGFTDIWGLGGFEVVNIFALRSTDPMVLRTHPDPIGAENDAAIKEAVERATIVVGAWGVHGAVLGRGPKVMTDLKRLDPMVRTLGWTKGGHPRHPLYLPTATMMQLA